MGILTNPSTFKKKSKYGKWLMKGNRLICFVLYVAGFVWFVLLGHKDLSNATYFSENALLPGLVYSEIKVDTINYALNLQSELERERETHKSTMPTAWLQAKMRQIGLDTFVHNFTLNYPLGGGKVFTGRNVYGILRAPRIGSTESFVITAPYRAPNSLHTEITHSIPLLLAFAKHARKQKYWAKDLIFLITEQEQLGMQAWLEAYQGGGSMASQSSSALQSGSLESRAGSIQAAINLEMQSFDVDYVDMKIEGLNGQLPNLDLVNLVQRIALKEGIVCGHRQTSTKRRSGAKSDHEDNFRHMLAMVMTQATGVPNGNHGLFHRYGIEALTIEGYRRDTTNHQRKMHGAATLLKLIEGVSRSVNNLLERFHQSFFFYLLVATDRFVSIGDYMPSLALMAGALLVKALIVWLTVNQSDDEAIEEDEGVAAADGEKRIATSSRLKDIDFNFIGVGKMLIIVHGIGFSASYLPYFGPLNRLADGIPTEEYLFGLFVAVSAVALTVPYVTRLSYVSIQIIHIAALLELSTALIIIGMLNFSLGLCLSVFIVPVVILINPQSSGRLSSSVTRLFCFLLNPLAAAYLTVLATTAISFGELTPKTMIYRALAVTKEAITFSVVDSIIYSNWIFDVVAIILLPVWICIWTVVLSRAPMAPTLTEEGVGKPIKNAAKIKSN